MNSDVIEKRRERTRIYKWVSAVLVIGLAAYLAFSLKALILPTIFGLLLAYICLPVTQFLQRKGIPKILSVILLLLIFFFSIFYLVVFVKNQLPDGDEQLRLRVVAMHQLNERYVDIMSLGSQEVQPNLLYQLVGFETDPVMDDINRYLALKSREIERFSKIFPPEDSDNARVWQFQQRNENLSLYSVGGRVYDSLDESLVPMIQFGDEYQSNIALFMNIFSIWLIMPLMFFFFLLDDGQLRKSLISLAPNTYFEMAHTSLKNVDKAIGMYLRGTVLETAAVFVAFVMILPLVGFNLTASVLIALVAAVFNIIPIVGSFAGVVVCMGYALLMEEVNSIFPFINENNVILFAAIAAIIVQLLDNTVFKPYVLGNAVDLHPLLVILSVIGGAIMFGFWGILFAVPVFVVVKVVVQTIHRQLKQYQIIDM